MRSSGLALTLSAALAAAATGSGTGAFAHMAAAKPAAQPRHFSLLADRHTERETKKGSSFKERLFRGTHAVGSATGACSFAGLHEGDAVPCTIKVALREGTIRVRGKLVPDAAQQRLSIVGGTAAYAGASGTVTSRALSGNRSRLFFTIA